MKKVKIVWFCRDKFLIIYIDLYILQFINLTLLDVEPTPRRVLQKNVHKIFWPTKLALIIKEIQSCDQSRSNAL